MTAIESGIAHVLSSALSPSLPPSLPPSFLARLEDEACVTFPLFLKGRKEEVKEGGVSLLLSAYDDSKKRSERRTGGREGGRGLTIMTLSLSSTVMEVMEGFRKRLEEEEEEGREEGGGEVKVVSGEGGREGGREREIREGGREGGREINLWSVAEKSHSKSSVDGTLTPQPLSPSFPPSLPPSLLPSLPVSDRLRVPATF